MLKSITIKNFKAIKDPGLTLNNLASVNYLVGKNGSGKSSVLENIILLDESKNRDQPNKQGVDLRNFKKNYSFISSGQIKNLGIYFDLPVIGYQIFKDLGPEFVLLIQKELDDFIKKYVYKYTNNLKIWISINHNERIQRDLSWLTTNIGHLDWNDLQSYVENFNKLRDEFKFNSKCIADRFDDKDPTEIFNALDAIWKDQVSEVFERYIGNFSGETNPDEYMVFYKNYVKSRFFNNSNILSDTIINKALGELDRENLYKILTEVGNLTTPFTATKFVYVDNTVIVFNDESNTSIPFSELSSGQKIIIILYFSINLEGINTLLIDEPEMGLHPDLQKQLPNLFNQFIEKMVQYSLVDCQIFISTHSPFIISAAAKLPDQKVYMIEGGKCLNPEGDLGPGAKRKANELLNVGLDDVMDKIIICEGSQDSNKCCEFDARVYNTIFATKDTYFVSAGGGEIKKNVRIARLVADKVFSGMVKTTLKDSDLLTENDKKKKIEEFAKDGLNLIFLKKQCIETYLLDKEVVDLFFKDCEVSEEFRKQFQPDKFLETKNTKHIVSDKLVKLIQQEYYSLRTISKTKDDVYFDLAKLINPEDTQMVYQELHNCIFDNKTQ